MRISKSPAIVFGSRLFVLHIIISYVITSCSSTSIPSPTLPTSTPIPSLPLQSQEAMINFRLKLIEALPHGDSLFLSILDEVTGLAFNPSDFIMTAEDATHYSVNIPMQIGTVVKYRYTRKGTTSVNEHLASGQPVRYRLYHVEGPGVVQDSLIRWTDTTFSGNAGRIKGQITDTSSGEPIPNLLISVGGAQTFTNTGGNYLIEGLPEGVHNLVAYAIDGMYQTYQQGAMVATNSTTPASFSLAPAPTVSVVFSVSVPESTPSDAPVRIAGNLYQLGNTFADLSGGVSTLASRMPLMSKLPDGRYVASLTLPVGAFVEYKYTLGDGLWNAEHSEDGRHLTRYLIVPESNTQVNNIVANWGTKQIAPIQFIVTVPAYTPSNEGISIQFNPGFGWMQPLPMWPAFSNQGNPIWGFMLISPIDAIGSIQYRICRADQCGIADDVNTQGVNPIGNSVSPSALPQTIIYNVQDWVWLLSAQPQASIPNVSINSHGEEFVAGIGFDSSYNPSWGSQVIDGITMVDNLGANWLIFSPTWSYPSISTPTLEILPGHDILLPDLTSYITNATALNFHVGLYPIPQFNLSPDQWWYESPRDFTWWVIWFEQYSQFILHHADIARRLNVESLILGGDWLLPALPFGTLEDGTSSRVPADAEIRWRELIDQIQARYQGTLIWTLPYPDGGKDPPPFIDKFDTILIQWAGPISSTNTPSVTEMHMEIARILDQEIFPLSQNIGKPIILGVEYPSADGSSMGCIPTSDGSCIPTSTLSATNPEISKTRLDLQEQVDIYNALFLAVNERDWISGLISMGYYPPVTLQDPSISIYTKPASGVLWYWFPRLLGNHP